MNTVEIAYEADIDHPVFSETYVRPLIMKVLDILGSDGIEVSCSFVSDATIQELNKTYRGKDEPTDILSFCQSDDQQWPDVFEESVRVLGDIIISVDAVYRNCTDFDVPVKEELPRLLIHGTLHLLGEEHVTNDSNEPMLVHQESILQTILKEFPIEILR
ncbi:MAG: rRNA maturation RNase YbeY [Sphaerochaetaceae bacterium]|jgi:probable rRNA maturation factor|nr:rRNA maturation RNase YbeY [Sphaerochaetaceae bacterium]MDX9809382.1 rRNA maturation RNase YbeY [Sphaerochaetaceae bacterium]NLV84092.1 rRNA maturation RNase YbeY [Spirochaetales bacterium]